MPFVLIFQTVNWIQKFELTVFFQDFTDVLKSLTSYVSNECYHLHVFLFVKCKVCLLVFGSAVLRLVKFVLFSSVKSFECQLSICMCSRGHTLGGHQTTFFSLGYQDSQNYCFYLLSLYLSISLARKPNLKIQVHLLAFLPVFSWILTQQVSTLMLQLLALGGQRIYIFLLISYVLAFSGDQVQMTFITKIENLGCTLYQCISIILVLHLNILKRPICSLQNTFSSLI